MRSITVLFKIFAFLLVTQLLFAEAQEQSQCEVGRVSLKNVQPFATTTNVFGEEANNTFHFCGTAGEESMCGGKLQLRRRVPLAAVLLQLDGRLRGALCLGGVRRAGAGGEALRITTVLVQQHTKDGEEIKQLLHELLEAVAAVQNSCHYIALVALDGSTQPITVEPHTTDITILETAIESLPVDTPDPQSKNLNGAIIFPLEGTYSMSSIVDGDCYASLVIFSDGYDTAGRVEAADTISRAEYFASKNVSILAFGTKNSLNSAFLRQVVNSGYFEANSEVSSTEALQEMAERITSAQNNVYHILISIPNRKGNVTVSVSLNPPETFPNMVPFEYILNTDGFTGGCNESLLNETIASLENASTSTLASKYPSPGGFINETVDAYGGFFFHTNCSEDECIVGASTNNTTDPDSFTVLVLTEPCCFLSPFCFNATFNDTYVLKKNVLDNYQFMLWSRLN
ncbi:hypothetical protein LSM04_009690 [Trypanosoma melophagium]|uniref:uncharacterized protein n=1 Tax=Trypanosoma melophagium TaxID=715481 RepID=UPI00351A9B6D|nr:hypothetical protein LSM04_009690 [Trypanosoma melophagium]